MPVASHIASPDHQLAAVVFTDVVGYTAMMQADEAQALRTIEQHRKVLEAATSRHKGEVLQYYGDGSLSLFPSALEAVQCALEVQRVLAQEPRVPLRIGIHLGDVKFQGQSLFGDAVNLAARVESLGVAGSILITDAVYYQVRNKPGIRAVPLGHFQLKNVDHPVPVYALQDEYLDVPVARNMPGRVVPGGGRTYRLVAGLALLVLLLAVFGWFAYDRQRVPARERSIAVLPFENRSNDPEQEYFSEGITDDITNHLVKVPQLRVKSRTSTQQYEDPDKTIPVIGRELGVSYIVEGSVRKEGNQVRIIAQLIDAEKDVQIWTHSYDREINEIFQIQSEIALEIAQVLEARLTSEEQRYIRGGPAGMRPPSDISAYDFLLRARANWRNWNDEQDLQRALRWVDEAIRIEPGYARAYVLKGQILHFGMRNYGVPTSVWIDEALAMSDRAIQLDSTLADAYLLKGRILGLEHAGSERARENLKKAFDLEPSNPEVFQSLGKAYLARGLYQQGIELLVQAVENGYANQDPEYFMLLADLHFGLGRDLEKAELLYLEAIDRASGWIEPLYRLGQLYRYWGKYEQAEEIAARGLAMAPLDQKLIDLLAWIHLQQGELASAASYWSQYEALESHFPDTTQYVPFRHRLGFVRYLQGDSLAAVRLVNEQIRLDEEREQNLRGYGVWADRAYYYDLMISHAFLGHREEALDWLQKVYDGILPNTWMPEYVLTTDPMLDPICDAPAFRRILEELTERQRRTQAAFEAVMLERGGA